MVAGYMNVTWSRQRHLLYAVLKSTLCKCGCNGRCTLDAVNLVINASFNCCSEGKHMTARFDGAPWQPGEEHRAALAGKSLPKIGVLTEYRADWPEMAAWSGSEVFFATSAFDLLTSI